MLSWQRESQRMLHTSKGQRIQLNIIRLFEATIVVCCICGKAIPLYSCLCIFSSRFPGSPVRDSGIVNRYSWFWGSVKVGDRGGEFTFFQSIHVRTDIRIHFSISIRHITTTFDKQVHLGQLTKMRLIK